MCRFCENPSNGGGGIIITYGERQTIMPLCAQCNINLQLHGISVCQNCGNVYFNNTGTYMVNYPDHCDECRYRKTPFVFKKGADKTA